MSSLARTVVFASVLIVVFAVSPAGAAGLLIADGGFGGVLEIEEHAVDVTINNGIAVTRVDQVFRNTENRQVEALYTFPVPEGASVANFSMWINGQEMVGEVLEKKRAREIYDSYKRRNRDPGLLEQVDYKTFEMRIFPIAAGAEQRVQITYYQELKVDDNWATYVYPLATVTRPNADSRVNGRFAIDFHAASKIPIVELSSPSHAQDFVIVQHDESYFQASLEQSGGQLARDVVLAFKMSRPSTGFDVISSIEDGEDGYFQLSLMVGDDDLKALDRGMDFVFVLDVSGSMDRDGKLAISRESINAFVDELGDRDRFELMTFNVSSETLFDSLTAVDQSTQSEAVDFLLSQHARGGTVLRPALDAAYRYKDPDRPLNVVILSDGMTEQRERVELLQAIAARPAGTRVFAIGVGNEVNRPLLQQLAEDAGGLAAFISRGDDFQRQARAFRRKLLRPSASNIEIDFAGGGVYDLVPSEIPDLFHGSPLHLYGRYREGGTSTIHFSADVGGERIERYVDIELPPRAAENPELERMWAWHRIDALLKKADRTGSRDAVVDEIVRLGEGYSIVTEYTSFLVLENDAEYRRWKIDRKNALRMKRDRAHHERVASDLAKIRDKARAELGPQAAAKAQESAKPRNLAPAGQPAQNTTRSQRSRGPNFSLGGGAFDRWSVALALIVALIAVVGGWRRMS